MILSVRSTSMKRGKSLDSIPIDLILEIFSRLPAKSVGRFRSVSKLWRSMLSRQDFTELFLTMSRAHPRFLFFVVRAGNRSLYSSPQPPNSANEKSSLVVAADVHMKFSHNMMPQFRSFTSGLIFFSNMWISKNNKDIVHVICNPSTKRFAILPKVSRYRSSNDFLAFDPIDKQFKVLSMGYPHSYDSRHIILTLGTGKIMWREIQCPLNLYRSHGEICINGVLYYLAGEINETLVIVCFDVRSEKFKFIHVDCFYDPTMLFKLINYKGKLGVIRSSYDMVHRLGFSMWVLEDAEKQKWLKHVYTLPENIIVKQISVVGMTARGELVLAMKSTSKQFYVFYLDPERNILQTVEIQGLANDSYVDAFVGHVEDLNVNDAKFLNSIQFENSIRKLRKQPTIL